MTEPARWSASVAQLDGALRMQVLRSVQLHSAVAAQLGVTLTDFNCLNVLSLEGPQTPGHLASRLGLTRGGAITTMVDRLEAAKYVRRRRDEHDRRRVLVELVPRAAAETIAPLFEQLGRAVSEYLSGFDESELRMLFEFSSRIGELTERAVVALRSTG